MIKKILFVIISLFAFAGGVFGAVYTMYDYRPCYPDNECYNYEVCVMPKVEQLYTTCELSGNCGCVSCEVSRVGTGFWNMRSSYEDRIIYMNNPQSMFRDDY
jgi:hypothetical protein